MAAFGCAATLSAVAASAGAQVAPREVTAEPLQARIALSREADLRLFSVRVRRLMAIELYGEVVVEERANGPLDGELIRVWIDVPTPERSLIEVRRSGRALARRALDITDLPSDIAARIVAIETAEMVRVQAAAGAGQKPPSPSTPDDDDARASRYAMEAALVTSWLPLHTGAWLVGPELSLEHRHGILGQRLFARWQLGQAGELGTLRWIQAGAGADVRLRIERGWWVRLGGTAAAAIATLPEAALVNGGESHTDWSASLGVLAGVEARTAGALFGASATADGLLRNLDVQRRGGDDGELGSLSLGLRLSIAAAPLRPPSRAPAE